MSGGTFQINSWQLEDVIEKIERVINLNKREMPLIVLDRELSWVTDLKKYLEKYPEEKLYYNYSDETINRFKEAVSVIKQAKIYIQRLDYLLASDDGEDSFIERLDKELKQLNNE